MASSSSSHASESDATVRLQGSMHRFRFIDPSDEVAPVRVDRIESKGALALGSTAARNERCMQAAPRSTHPLPCRLDRPVSLAPSHTAVQQAFLPFRILRSRGCLGRWTTSTPLDRSNATSTHLSNAPRQFPLTPYHTHAPHTDRSTQRPATPHGSTATGAAEVRVWWRGGVGRVCVHASMAAASIEQV